MPTEIEPLLYESILERDGVRVSKSPWGPDDEIGRLNWITADSRRVILEAIDATAVFDLSVDYFIGMPSWVEAGDPRYTIYMTHTPQGSVHDGLSGASAAIHEKYSYCGDAVEMYTHCGTHIDTLNHLGHFGCFWNGWTPEEHLGSRHWMKGGAEKYPPLIGRGVLLDVAGLHGVNVVPDVYEVTPDDLRNAAREQGTELRRGDIAMIRTGRMNVWPDFDGYTQNQPGVGLAAAKYMCEDVGECSWAPTPSASSQCRRPSPTRSSRCTATCSRRRARRSWKSCSSTSSQPNANTSSRSSAAR